MSKVYCLKVSKLQHPVKDFMTFDFAIVWTRERLRRHPFSRVAEKDIAESATAA